MIKLCALKNFVLQANQTTLNVTFSLDKWPRSCCQFDAQVNILKSILLSDVSVLLKSFFQLAMPLHYL